MGKSVNAWSCSGEQTALTAIGVSLGTTVEVRLGSGVAVEEGVTLGLGVRVADGTTQAANKATRRQSETGFTSPF